MQNESNSKLEPVRSLWIGTELPTAQSACLRSFLRVGHSVELFCYSKVEGLHADIIVRDAREILSEDQIFAYGAAAGAGEGSFSAFSNIFRYKLLQDLGGYWVDTDMFCVKPLPTSTIVVASERNELKEITAATCVLKFPPHHPIIKFCLTEALKCNRQTLTWGKIGPELVHRALLKFNILNRLSHPAEFCPINWTEFEQLNENFTWLGDPFAVHLWNESWRRSKKEIPYPGVPNSIINKLSLMLEDSSNELFNGNAIS